MEIRITNKGKLRVLAAKGKIRLQNWRVLDKHLGHQLESGCRHLVMDLSDVTLICSTGIGSLLQNVRKFQEEEGELLLLCTTPYLREILETFGLEKVKNESFFTDWEAMENHLRARGLTVPT